MAEADWRVELRPVGERLRLRVVFDDEEAYGVLLDDASPDSLEEAWAALASFVEVMLAPAPIEGVPDPDLGPLERICQALENGHAERAEYDRRLIERMP